MRPPGPGEGGGVELLLSGATGFVGGALAPLLVEAGHDVRAMTRRPAEYDGPGTAVEGDTEDEASLRAAMEGCEAAYYLVHGLESSSFEEADARAAQAFGRAAKAAGVRQIVYLGGLGRQGDDLSEHLASRQEVEGRLGQGGVPVTTLRAALVIGAGSASFELLRQLVAHSPVRLVPRGATSTRVQPIALADALRYLVDVLGAEVAVNRVFEVGGPDVLTYAELLDRMAQLLGRRWLPRLPIPVVPQAAARLGARVLTDVEPELAANLLDSLGNDVVVTDGDVIARLFPGPLATVDEMLRSALGREPTS